MNYKHVKDHWLFYVYGLTVLIVISLILISDLLAGKETKVNWFWVFIAIVIMTLIIYLINKFWNKK